MRCTNPKTATATQMWRKACETVGLKNFRWHDLRHTWASWHAQDGTPLHVLQELGGWESAEMVRRYAHLSTVHLSDYVNRRQALRDVSVTVREKGAKQKCLTPLFTGAPGGSRTHDPWLRKPILYPAELRALYKGSSITQHYHPRIPRLKLKWAGMGDLPPNAQKCYRVRWIIHGVCHGVHQS